MSIAQFSADGKGFGAAALAKARAAGYSDAQIKQQVAAQGLTLGGAAAQALGSSSGGGGGAASPSATASSQASGGGGLSQFAGSGGSFGLAAMQRAQQAGLSSNQIKARLAGSGLTIGGEVQRQLGIGANGYPADVRSEPMMDAGSGALYNVRGVATDTHGVVYASGPMSAQAIRSFLANEPEANWVLPASAAAPGQPYQAPQGVRAVAPVGMGGRPELPTAKTPAAAASEAGGLLESYQQQLQSITSSYASSLKQLDSDREAARARADAYEQQRQQSAQWEANLQLQGLRSGSTVGGSPGSGLGNLSSGRSSTFRSDSSGDASPLTTYLRNQALDDSVLNRKGPVVEAMTSNTGSGGSADARRRALTGGAASYYASRFG